MVAESTSDAHLLKPNIQAMYQLSMGSSATIATLMCIPDAIGIIPVVPSFQVWGMRMIGLWLSAFILWFLGFSAMLHMARFVGRGIVTTKDGISFWRFGKFIPWKQVKAITVDEQPFFTRAFRLKNPARRLIIYEQKQQRFSLPALKAKRTSTKNGSAQVTYQLTPHAIPSFQFSNQEFTSLFAHTCIRAALEVPNSLETYMLPDDVDDRAQLKAANERGVLIRRIMSVVIALGLVLFLVRRSSLNYFFNAGIKDFRQEQYEKSAKSFATATKIDPIYAPGWDQLARSEFRQNKLTEAEQHWHKALAMKPDFIEAKLGLSNIYLMRGQLEQAKKLLDQCAILYPHNAAVYLNQAQLYLQSKDSRSSRRMLELLETEFGNDADSIARAAKIYFDLNDLEKARALCKSSLALAPGNRFAQALLRLIDERGVK